MSSCLGGLGQRDGDGYLGFICQDDLSQGGGFADRRQRLGKHPRNLILTGDQNLGLGVVRQFPLAQLLPSQYEIAHPIRVPKAKRQGYTKQEIHQGDVGFELFLVGHIQNRQPG